MTEYKDPLENHITERVFGIMKEENPYPKGVKSKKDTIKYLHMEIILYNRERPNMSM